MPSQVRSIDGLSLRTYARALATTKDCFSSRAGVEFMHQYKRAPREDRAARHRLGAGKVGNG